MSPSLLRTLESAVRGRSRIPHIAAHIVQRRAPQPPPPIASTNGVVGTASTPVRGHATIASASIAPTPIALQDSVQDSAPASQHTYNDESSTKAADPVDQISKTLAEIGQHPERALHALCHPQLGSQLIQKTSDAEFEHVFSLLDPAHLLDERKKIDRAINPRLYYQFSIRRTGSLGHKFDWYLHFLERVVSLRRAAGFPLTLGVYRHLLKWAEAVGSELLARDLFISEMPRDGVEPDLEAYNSYLGACVWNGAWEVDFRYRRRNLPDNVLLRERVMPLLKGDEIAKLTRPRYQRPEHETLRGHALTVFDRLIEQGLAPDETTFANLMLAMAYDGDLQGVKAVLKSTWNIDVDMLDKYDEEEIESPTFYEEGHRLRPSAKLLHAVVYAFGTNNDSFHASFLLDYISRNYNLAPIPEDVWMLLYELTFVLAQRFGQNRTRRGHAVGRLPEDALARLGAMIADEPHNVKPNTWMLTRLATNARKARRELDATVEAFRDACKLREHNLTRVSKLYDEMLDECDLLAAEKKEKKKAGDGDVFIPSARFLDKRREFILESLKLDRDLEGLRQEFKMILVQGPWQFNISPWDSSGQWSVYTVPHLIREFATFLPSGSAPIRVEAAKFEYTIDNVQWHHQRALTDAHGHFDVRAARLRNQLDVDLDLDLNLNLMPNANANVKPNLQLPQVDAELDTRTRTSRLILNACTARAWMDRFESSCLVCRTTRQHSRADCPRWELGLAGHGLKYGVEEMAYDE